MTAMLRVVPDDVDAGLVPPHDLDAEAAVISALILDPAAFALVESFLAPEHCYSEPHRRIMEAIYALKRQSATVDTVTVGSYLKGNDRLGQVGGMAYLTEILDAAPAVVNVREYGMIVFNRWRSRRTIDIARETIAHGYVDAPNDVQSYVERAANRLTALAEMQPERVRESNGQVVARHVREVRDAKNLLRDGGPQANANTGIPTGFRGIDNLTGGLKAGHKITIAAMGGCGKTTIGIQIARNVVDLGIGVLYMAAEQSHQELVLKAISQRISVPWERIADLDLSPKGWADLTAESAAIDRLPLWFDSRTEGMTVEDVRSAAVAQAAKCERGGPPLGLVVVDHLHELALSSGFKSDQRPAAISHATKMLKQLARELSIPVLELAQAKEKDSPGPGQERPRPGNLDVQWSQDVRKSADALLFLHRPFDKSDRVVVIGNKCRWAKPDDVELVLEGEFSRFKVPGEDEYR